LRPILNPTGTLRAEMLYGGDVNYQGIIIGSGTSFTHWLAIPTAN
jgi:hypothetical protein